jgi:hypothetical protein
MTSDATKIAHAEPLESPAGDENATPTRRRGRKRGCLLIAAAAVFAAGSIATAIYSRLGDDAPLALRPAQHDFGTVQAGAVVQTTVQLRNRSGQPIEIKRVSSDCGCTVTDLPKAKLSPRDKTTLSAEVNTSGVQGPFNVRVAVFFVVEGEQRLRAAFVLLSGHVKTTVQ